MSCDVSKTAAKLMAATLEIFIVFLPTTPDASFMPKFRGDPYWIALNGRVSAIAVADTDGLD
jgi:hypothetical protein